MQPYIRYFILRKAKAIVNAIGGFRLPITSDRISIGLKQMVKMDKFIIPGAVVLSRTFGNGSNLLIPGYWKHAAIVVGANTLIHAVGAGVEKIRLEKFLADKDEVAILWPRYLTQIEMSVECSKAYRYLGLPYDDLFDPRSNSVYCSELIWLVYKDKLKGFKRKDIMGVKTIMPSDLIESPHFEAMYISDKPSLGTIKDMLYSIGL